MREIPAAGPVAVVATPLQTLSSKALLVYESMRAVGAAVGERREYAAEPTQIHFFAPGEVVADALAMARSTLYLKLDELKEAQLIEARAHYVEHDDRTKADGMVWAVKMHPERPGRVTVPYDALKASYRCLSADIESGRTAWAQVGQSKQNPSREVDTKKILAWALPPPPTQNPVIGLTVRPDFEAILDVPFADHEDRSAAVDGAARALASGLGDPSSLMFYRWLLWQLLRLGDQLGTDYWHQVYEQARRARTDAAEGFARRPGALFASRLKAAPWWDEATRASGRVGPVSFRA